MLQGDLDDELLPRSLLLALKPRSKAPPLAWLYGLMQADRELENLRQRAKVALDLVTIHLITHLTSPWDSPVQNASSASLAQHHHAMPIG